MVNTPLTTIPVTGRRIPLRPLQDRSGTPITILVSYQWMDGNSETNYD